VISTLGGTWARDMQHHTALAGYTWDELPSGAIRLSASFDGDWLSQAEFPLDVDPLITGPIAAFGDNMMLSCYIPQYNVDSLLVTIPGQTTVTAFMVTASFYADPFAFSIMSDGSMYFSTSCAQTQTFEVQPPTGDLAGTAYLENFDMRNPLLCCYAPQCADTSFYLRMHLGRYTPAGDCDATSVYYTPTTLWPFTAYIEGHTVETYGAEWSVTNTAICSNVCEVEGKARVKFGVPPYTLTHPWSDGEIIQEEPTPCDISGKQVDVPMVWPGCPMYCPSPTPFTQDVPPPIIMDACGNFAEGIDAEILNIKAAPSIEDPSPVVVCPNSNESLQLNSCAPTFQIVWAGNGTSGQGPVPLNLENPTEGNYEYYYLAHVEWNGCKSDTIAFTVVVVTNPTAEFHVAPDPIMQNIPAYLIADTVQVADPIEEVWWIVDGLPTAEGGVVQTVLNSLGWSEVCMVLKSEEGCIDTTCKDFEVVTASIDIPNIFTPNGDGLNEVFEIKYLDFFPENQIEIYDRWGVKVFEDDNYRNNWSAQDMPDGVYYYILHVKYLGDYSGYVKVGR
ncbi:MAG: gliding motility-associated C-terminal domain-containing protein, partial [Flavobacteriales bacterium]